MLSNSFKKSANCDAAVQRLIRSLNQKLFPQWAKQGQLEDNRLASPLTASVRDEYGVLMTFDIDEQLNVSLETRGRKLCINYVQDKKTKKFSYKVASGGSAFHGPEYLMIVDALNQKIEKNDAMGNSALKFKIPLGSGMKIREPKKFDPNAKADIPDPSRGFNDYDYAYDYD